METTRGVRIPKTSTSNLWPWRQTNGIHMEAGPNARKLCEFIWNLRQELVNLVNSCSIFWAGVRNLFVSCWASKYMFGMWADATWIANSARFKCSANWLNTLFGCVVGSLVGWLFSCLASWLAGFLAGWLAVLGTLAACWLLAWLARCLLHWIVGRLVSCSAG